MPRRSSSVFCPMPESISSCGERNAPAETIISGRVRVFDGAETQIIDADGATAGNT